MIKIIESGYYGYSMSNNAVSAYEDGEKPISKWTKSDIIDNIAEYNKELANTCKGLSVGELRSLFLYRSSWHHTSNYYNRTDFYSFDDSAIDSYTVDDINKRIELNKSTKKEPKPEKDIRRGNIHYIEWTGTRNYPKANHKELTNVNIEVKGSFYVVTDDNGRELIRKKIGSNGTEVKYYK